MKESTFVKRSEDLAAESFRLPMPVNEVHLYRDNMAFSVCPRCRTPLEREYQSYCDRCGQALDWKRFKKALVVLIN